MFELKSVRVLLSAWIIIGCAVAYSDDWPTYRHDVARSGVTTEQLNTPLSERWVFKPRHGPEPAWGYPKPVPIENILERPRVHFDDAFHVTVAGDSLYFGSSSDNKIYSLDVKTAKIRWTFITGGPVRLAPTIWNDKVFFGSDDGFVYCLSAESGKAVWKFQAAPHDDKVLGHGKMISLWPVRTGVLVDDSIAYFGAGIFPAEGVYLYAVRAEDGTMVWQNDTTGESPWGRTSPQGYLLASPTMLYAPMARVSPSAFDRANGKLMYSSYFGKRIGGTYALLADQYLYTGTGEIIAQKQKTRERFAWFQGRQLMVTPDFSYMLTDREITALNRRIYPKASRRRQSALDRKARLNNPLAQARRRRGTLTANMKKYQGTLNTLDKQLSDLAKKAKTDEKEIAKLKAQRAAALAKFESETKALDSARREVAKLEEQERKLNDELKKAEAVIRSATKWKSPCKRMDSMILAGSVLFVGGQDEVIAVDAATGEKLWRGSVEGKARGLAVAAGRLFVSTNQGAIHCFGNGGSQRIGSVTPAVDASPYPRDKLTKIYEKAADAIVRATGVKRGYCLVLGCETGRLALELAKRTELMIYAIAPDAEKTAAARKPLDSAGVYGARVCVETWPLSKVPYSDYFANLIVSETALVKGELPPSQEEMFRMLKPIGGAVYIGQPAEASGVVEALRASDVSEWLKKSGISGETIRESGVWMKIVRGPLEGAGSWTHEYAEPGNTACGDDEIAKTPLGVQWFGRPGPGEMVNRHRGAAGPLCVNGRLFVQGDNVVMAYDAYNGLKLWEREIRGAIRTGMYGECSNLVANEDSFFVAAGDECFQLDAATGETRTTYAVPPSPDGKRRNWGYVACVDNLLYGSTTTGGRWSDRLFAIDIASGEPKWTHTGKNISHVTIAINGGGIFFTDRVVTAAERREALKGVKAAGSADVRLVVALDAKTGEKRWQRAIDFTDCSRISNGGGELFEMCHNGVLVFAAAANDGHYWQQFFAGDFKRRKVIALSAKDGSLLWQKPIGYRIRPLIVGDTLIAEPWGFDLKTGEQKQRIHPMTGEEVPWQFVRPGHHCGSIAASRSLMLFRSYCIGYYDLAGDGGTMHFGAQRPGCHINFIPAAGLVLIPEASSGCMCPFPNMCTVVLKHRKVNRAWSMFASAGELTPVKRFAINIGAPGDRRDQEGTLWLSYPRPHGHGLMLHFKLSVNLWPGGGWFKRNSDTIEVRGTDKKWLFASGVEGVRRCVIPLLREADGSALYTVRLMFADLENEKPGDRVFDIKLQRKAVQKGFDLVKEAGGGHRAVVKEFEGIEVKDNLTIELVPKVANPPRQRGPILQAVEIVREKMLTIGISVPSFLLNNMEREQEGVVRIVNHKYDKFAGTLSVKSPNGFTITPNQTQIELTSGQETTVTLKAALGKKVAGGKYAAEIKLIRKDGGVESERQLEIENLADRGRVVLKAVEDAYAQRSNGDRNVGTAATLNVDGGDQKMGDHHHSLAYLKFRLDVPGKPISATLRLFNAGNPTGNSGTIRLVEGRWNEKEVTYNNRPKLGDVLADIGRISENQIVEMPLKISLERNAELSLAIDPTTCDGVNYTSREAKKPAELVVEYEAQ